MAEEQPEAAADDGAFRCSWLDAESAAAEALVEVIDQAADELYDHYLEDNSYPFACEIAADIFRARMGMAFVPFDEGEKDDADWLPEPPPDRPPLDAWARTAVPVMKKREAKPAAVAPAAKEKPQRKTLLTQPKVEESKEVRQWSLAVEPELDPDEEAVREVKTRDDRKKQNEIQRQQKLKEESENAAKAAKGRATEMEQKQFAFDSNGTVFFVQPVAPHTLPSPVTLPNYKFHGKDNIPPDPNMSSSSHMAAPPRGAPPKDGRGRRKRKEPQFTDLFTKLANQQPHTIDVIELAPGVVCSENGKNRSGPEKEKETLMTKAAYDEMVKQGEPMVTQQRSSNVKADEPPPQVKKVEADEQPPALAAPEPPEPRRVPPPPSEFRTPKAAAEQDDFNASIAKGSNWGENPGSPGKVLNQARPPPIAHSMKLKRDAIGNLGKVPRDRIVGLGSMGRRQPQPPLGAVMGHGLYGDGEAGEFYFPDGASAGSPNSPGKTKRPPQGYEAEAISHALNLNAQREKSGGTIATRRQDLVRSMLH
jgi:hypothetical protein